MELLKPTVIAKNKINIGIIYIKLIGTLNLVTNQVVYCRFLLKIKYSLHKFQIYKL